MPTGYTATLYDGDQDFPDFVMTCARAFGALVTMRDAPFDAPIPDRFEPSGYARGRLEEARAKVEAIGGWTSAEAQAHADEAYEAAHASWVTTRRTSDERVTRYQAMLAEVEAWTPPTPDHEGLKEFMREQLTDSIAHDGRDDEFWPEPQRTDGETFRAREMARATRDVEYYTKEWDEDQRRARERTEWVSALRGSLSTEEAAPC